MTFCSSGMSFCGIRATFCEDQKPLKVCNGRRFHGSWTCLWVWNDLLWIPNDVLWVRNDVLLLLNDVLWVRKDVLWVRNDGLWIWKDVLLVRSDVRNLSKCVTVIDFMVRGLECFLWLG